MGPHAGWLLLAALGLFAVLLAAFTVRRPSHEGRSLMEMTTAIREIPSEQNIATRDVRRVVAPASEPPSIAAPTSAPAVEARATFAQPIAIDMRADATLVSKSPTPIAPVSQATAPSRTADGEHLFLALHHVDLSIDVLRRHIVAESRPMPAVWLMLLDLARTHGREQTFRELAQQFHARFNSEQPTWDGFPPDRDQRGLEAYPRLVKEITRSWGTHECRRLLDRLLYDNRSGDRKGFTLNAYQDLIALRRAADAVIHMIEQDLLEEAKVRSAYASATLDIPAASDTKIATSPLVADLEQQLDGDLARTREPCSSLESEHPALAGMLAREWGNAALSARLYEMLARGGDGAHELSKEAADELEFLRAMAKRLASVNGLHIASASLADEPLMRDIDT